MSVEAVGHNGDLHALLACLHDVSTSTSRVSATKQSLALVNEANGPWHRPPVSHLTPSGDLQTCQYNLDRGSFTVKNSWWDATNLNTRQKMGLVCYEIRLFSRRAEVGLRSFMMHDIEITEADVCELLEELKHVHLEVLILSNVNLDDQGVNFFVETMKEKCTGRWKNLTRISLVDNSRISDASKKMIRKEWTKQYGRNNYPRERFFLFL